MGERVLAQRSGIAEASAMGSGRRTICSDIKCDAATAHDGASGNQFAEFRAGHLGISATRRIPPPQKDVTGRAALATARILRILCRAMTLVDALISPTSLDTMSGVLQLHPNT